MGCFGFVRSHAETLLDGFQDEAKRLRLRAEIASTTAGHVQQAARAATLGSTLRTFVSCGAGTGADSKLAALRFSGESCQLRLWPTLRFELAYRTPSIPEAFAHHADAGLARFTHQLDRRRVQGRWHYVEKTAALQMALEATSDASSGDEDVSDDSAMWPWPCEWSSQVSDASLSVQLPMCTVVLDEDDAAAGYGLC